MTPTTTEQPATDAAPRFRIEPANAESLAYVLSTWGRTLETKLEAIPQPGFLKAFAPIQARIIKRSKVLTSLDKDGRIVAFCIYEPSELVLTPTAHIGKTTTLVSLDGSHPAILHWISTRKEVRQQGAANQLIIQAGLRSGSKPLISTWTSDLRYLGLADAPYTPFWLRSL